MDWKKFFSSKPFLVICSVIITVILTAVFLNIVLPIVTKEASTWGATEIAIIISFVAIIAQIAPPFLERILQKQNKTYYSIGLNVSVLNDGNVLFDATIQNEGLVTVRPQYTRLYIDQGLPSEGPVYKYGFPFILEHKNSGDNDCVLCTRCKIEGNQNYPIDSLPDKYKSEMISGKLYCGCFVMEHLSEKSIKYIRAHERFQEDVILKFDTSGVYRAILVVITHNADCQCATKQFYVKVDNAGSSVGTGTQ